LDRPATLHPSKLLLELRKKPGKIESRKIFPQVERGLKKVLETFLVLLAGCTKAFSQLSNLQSHSRCHQTDKPYKCNSCYKCFADEQALFEHIPKHKESKHIKTHICSYCGKSYTQVCQDTFSMFYLPFQ
jgi:hypothetical protein